MLTRKIVGIIKKKKNKSFIPVLDSWYFENKILYVDTSETDTIASRKHHCVNYFKMSTKQSSSFCSVNYKLE